MTAEVSQMISRRIAPAAVSVVLTAAFAVAADVERVERGTLVLEGIPEVPAELEARLDQYSNVRSASLGGWHPSQPGILVTTRFGETSQVHWVAEPGGARRQLTFFDEPVGSVTPSPSPETNGFIYSRDVGGSEFYQLYFFDLASGRSTLLTDGTSRNGSASWAHDGTQFCFVTTRRNGTDWDVHLADVRKPGESKPLLEAGGYWFVDEWSPDDSRVLVVRYVSINESYPYVLDVASGELTPLHEGDERVAYRSAVWSPDGGGVYYTSDEGSEFLRLRHMDLASGERTVLSGAIPWDVRSLAISPDGRHLAFTVNHGGMSRLHLWRLPERRPVGVPPLPQGVVYGLEFSPDSTRLGLVLNRPTSPGDVYHLELASGALTRWTFSEVGGLDPAVFDEPQLVHYPTFDTVDGEPRLIPAFYYRPDGPGPHPVLIDIHGGPEGQERPTFSPTIQFWVNELGLAVLTPNVRGSSGYGKSYLLLDNAERREDSVRDIGALLEWIGERPELDGARIGVIGGSYGGYMVLASAVHYSDRLRAAVDVVGISNFVTFLENTKPYRRDMRRAEYGDERDPDMRRHLLAISPTTNAEEISIPLLVVQGLNDPRVPASEAEQIVEAVRSGGGEVWYLLATDEGHGFKKKSNREAYYAAVAMFLERFLLPEPAADADRAVASPSSR